MRRSLLLILWLAADIVLFLGAYVAAYFLRVGFIMSTDFPMDLYLRTVLVVSPLWLGVLWQLGVFRLLRVQSDKRNLLHILFACVMGSAMFTLAYYFLHGQFFSRLLLVEAGVINLILTSVWHLAFDQWQRKLLRRDPPSYPTLVIGCNRETEKLVAMLQERQCPLKPVAILDGRGTPLKEIAGVPVLGRLNKLEEVIREKRISHLIQCSDLEHTINLLSVARQHGITYMLLPSVLGAVGGSEESVNVEGKAMIMVNDRS